MSRHLSTAAPAGCRAALWSAGGCWPFWAPERQGGRAAAGGGGAVGGCQVSGVMVCRWWPSGWPAWRLLLVCRGWLGGGDPAAICGGNSAVFNQLLTTFIVIAMVWRLTMFFLCSYWQFRRRWRLFRSPGAGRGLADGLGGLRVGGMGLLAVRIGKGRGSGKRDGASQDGGRVLPHIIPAHPRPVGGRRKTGRGAFCNPGLKSSEPHAGLSKFQVLIGLALNGSCDILKIGKTI